MVCRKLVSAAGRSAKAAEQAGLRPVQLAWLAGSVFVVSAGYGALMPLLPGWLAPMMPAAAVTEVARQVGFLRGSRAVSRIGDSAATLRPQSMAVAGQVKSTPCCQQEVVII